MQVATRRYHTVQMGLYVVIMGSVFFAERLNALAGAHWESLGFTQNYFDKKGVFICSLWSTPLLLIGAVMLLQSLYTSASLLIKVTSCLDVLTGSWSACVTQSHDVLIMSHAIS